MESGAHGCEIDIAGKLTGPRKRTEKFVAGNMLHAGNPAMELVDKGFAIAIKKLGIIGCRVRIVPPSVTLPGRFNTVKGPEPQADVSKQPGIADLVKTPAQVKPETPVLAKEAKPVNPVKSETVEITKPQVGGPSESGVEHATVEGNIEERQHGDVKEHKHAGYEYWHPASRMHKTEEN
jgi:small subunit ribosomal protein S3